MNAFNNFNRALFGTNKDNSLNNNERAELEDGEITEEHDEQQRDEYFRNLDQQYRDANNSPQQPSNDNQNDDDVILLEDPPVPTTNQHLNIPATNESDLDQVFNSIRNEVTNALPFNRQRVNSASHIEQLQNQINQQVSNRIMNPPILNQYQQPMLFQRRIEQQQQLDQQQHDKTTSTSITTSTNKSTATSQSPPTTSFKSNANTSTTTKTGTTPTNQSTATS